MSSRQNYTLQLEKLRELIKYLEFFNAEMLQIMNNYQKKLLTLENEGVPAEVIAKFHKDFFAESKDLIKRNEAIINDEAIPFVYKNINGLEQFGNSKPDGFKRTLASVAVPFAAVAPGVSSAAQVIEMSRYGIVNEVPAIYKELQTAGELAENIQDIGEAFLDGRKLKDDAEKVEELSNALREPEQGEYRDE